MGKMRVGVAIVDTWGFFHEVFEELKRNHQVTLFQRRTINLPVFHKWFNDSLYHRDLTGFLRNNDVVFFEWASEVLVYASRLRKYCGMVTRLHRYEMYQWAPDIKWDSIDKVILVSEAKKREFTRRFPDQSHKVVVIPEGIDVGSFTPDTKQFSGDIGILCHLTPRKRVYELILAFYELTKIRDGFHLHIGGGSRSRFMDYFGALHTLVEKLNLEDKITFYDNVENPQEWYKKVDIFISNSYSEGLQVAPMEAMAAGIYCLTHHWDGADELLPQDNLYYSERELIDHILCYADLPDHEKVLRQKQMRAIVEDRFDINKIALQITAVVNEVGSIRVPNSKIHQ
jgi:glycosyltransferase involved in cell wall biosynthesis